VLWLVVTVKPVETAGVEAETCPVVEAAEEAGMVTVTTPVETSVEVVVVTPSEHVPQGTVIVVVMKSVVTLVLMISEPLDETRED